MDTIGGVAPRQEAELIEALRRGDLYTAGFLVDSGADVNYKVSQDGSSYLHWACKNNNFTLASFLLSRGADRLSKNKLGQTPRDVTTSPEIVALLQNSDSPCATSPFRTFNDLPHNMVNKSACHAHHAHPAPPQDILLKVRIANSADTDFIEIELPSCSTTYQNLLLICCQELEVHPENVSRIRKLPDTRIRSDADVRRLKALQELEVVLKEGISSVSHPISANIYPSISANKNQTVLY